jgi:hypothetical protein
MLANQLTLCQGNRNPPDRARADTRFRQL